MTSCLTQNYNKHTYWHSFDFWSGNLALGWWRQDRVPSLTKWRINAKYKILISLLIYVCKACCDNESRLCITFHKITIQTCLIYSCCYSHWLQSFLMYLYFDFEVIMTSRCIFSWPRLIRGFIWLLSFPLSTL